MACSHAHFSSCVEVSQNQPCDINSRDPHNPCISPCIPKVSRVPLSPVKLQFGLLKNGHNILGPSVGSFEVEDLGAGLRVAHASRICMCGIYGSGYRNGSQIWIRFHLNVLQQTWCSPTVTGHPKNLLMLVGKGWTRPYSSSPYAKRNTSLSHSPEPPNILGREHADLIQG